MYGVDPVREHNLALSGLLILLGLVPLVTSLITRSDPRKGWGALTLAVLVVAWLMTSLESLTFNY